MGLGERPASHQREGTSQVRARLARAGKTAALAVFRYKWGSQNPGFLIRGSPW